MFGELAMMVKKFMFDTAPDPAAVGTYAFVFAQRDMDCPGDDGGTISPSQLPPVAQLAPAVVAR